MLTNELFIIALQNKKYIHNFQHIKIKKNTREFGESTQPNPKIVFSKCAFLKGLSLWTPVKLPK